MPESLLPEPGLVWVRPSPAPASLLDGRGRSPSAPAPPAAWAPPQQSPAPAGQSRPAPVAAPAYGQAPPAARSSSGSSLVRVAVLVVALAVGAGVVMALDPGLRPTVQVTLPSWLVAVTAGAVTVVLVLLVAGLLLTRGQRMRSERRIRAEALRTFDDRRPAFAPHLMSTPARAGPSGAVAGTVPPPPPEAASAKVGVGMVARKLASSDEDLAADDRAWIASMSPSIFWMVRIVVAFRPDAGAVVERARLAFSVDSPTLASASASTSAPATSTTRIWSLHPQLVSRTTSASLRWKLGGTLKLLAVEVEGTKEEEREIARIRGMGELQPVAEWNLVGTRDNPFAGDLEFVVVVQGPEHEARGQLWVAFQESGEESGAAVSTFELRPAPDRSVMLQP